MLINLLLNLFLFGFMQHQPTAEVINDNIQTVAAASADRQVVEGYDETTAMSFSHSLPFPLCLSLLFTQSLATGYGAAGG